VTSVKHSREWLKPATWFKGEIGPAEQMALGMGVALLVLSIVTDLRGHHLRAEKLSIIATLIAALGILYPRAIIPLEKILRNTVLYLAGVNTKVALTLVYYLVFTPASFLLKLFGKKLLETDFRKKVDSYFETRQEKEYTPEQDKLQF